VTDDPVHLDDTPALSTFSKAWRWTAIVVLIALPFILAGVFVVL
jgi:hypothetical protein